MAESKARTSFGQVAGWSYGATGLFVITSLMSAPITAPAVIATGIAAVAGPPVAAAVVYPVLRAFGA